MEHINYMEIAHKAMDQIKKGAFLNVQSNDLFNTMTIGWASLGFQWGRPIMTVLVRKSRYTFDIIEKTDEFTVSIPSSDYSKELGICGSKSGRNLDKVKECGFKLLKGQNVNTPILDIPGIHIECKIVYKTPMDPAQLTQSYHHLYPNKDYHTLYFGEIVYCYSR